MKEKILKIEIYDFIYVRTRKNGEVLNKIQGQNFSLFKFIVWQFEKLYSIFSDCVTLWKLCHMRKICSKTRTRPKPPEFYSEALVIELPYTFLLVSIYKFYTITYSHGSSAWISNGIRYKVNFQSIISQSSLLDANCHRVRKNMQQIIKDSSSALRTKLLGHPHNFCLF
jgi:hypothetical protein